MTGTKWARRLVVLGIVVPLSSVIITSSPTTVSSAASGGSGTNSVNIADE